MPLDMRLRMRRSMLLKEYGTPLTQKNALVKDILDCFQDPQKWPLVDHQRVELLRLLYRKAQTIIETEEALRASPESVPTFAPTGHETEGK